MYDATWPPSADLLAWRPVDGPPDSSLPDSLLRGEDDALPDWVAVPADAKPDGWGEIHVPTHGLAYVETDAGRPGGGGFSSIHAVPATDGGLRIVITNDDEIPFVSPIERLDALPTLGELLRILDETEIGGEVWGVGHPARENSDTGHREELRRFLTISSDLYPMLEPLDRSRLEQWIAERP